MKQLEYITSLNEAAAVTAVRQSYVNEHADQLIDWIDMTADSVHLDLPCGAGGMMQRIREKGYMGFTYLADINPAMLEAASLAVPERAAYILTDAVEVASAIPEKVDSITTLNGFHIYIDEKQAFLNGCAEVLRPGGKMIFDVSTMSLNHPSKALLDRHDELMREGAADLGSTANLPSYAQQGDLEQYAEMASQAGLTVIGRHVVEKMIPIKNFEDATIQIPGRLRSRFPGLSDQQRAGLFLETSARAQIETGHTGVPHTRLFYTLRKSN